MLDTRPRLSVSDASARYLYMKCVDVCVKMACQDADDDVVVDDDEEEEAEHDCALVESAGELMPTLVKLIGGPTFAPYFAELLPELLKRLVRNESAV